VNGWGRWSRALVVSGVSAPVFDQFCKVFRGSVRHVAVSPGGMLACRSSGQVEERRLPKKHKWPVGREISFGLDYLL
jgi:hypothetical protein